MPSLRRQLPAYSPLPFAAVRAAARGLFGYSSALRDSVSQRLCDEYGARNVLLVGSGTMALRLALAGVRAAIADRPIALPAYSCYDVASAAEFYDAVLGALGYKRTAQYLPYAVAYGEGVSEFWIQLPHDKGTPSAGNGVHYGFRAKNQNAVHRFHASSRAFLFSGVASGAWPARMKPCAAPSYVTGSYVFPAFFIRSCVAGMVDPMRESLPA